MILSSIAQSLIEKYPESISRITMDCEIIDAALCSADKPSFSPDCLAIFSPEQLVTVDVLPFNFLCAGELESQTYDRINSSQSNYILIPEANLADALCYVLAMFGNTIKQQRLYSDLICMLMRDGDLSQVLSKFSKETDCPMLIIDISGKVIAYSKPFKVNHPHWQHSVEVGYLDKYLIEYILSYRVKNKMSLSPEPFTLFCDRLQLHIRVVRIIANGDLAGYVFMGNRFTEFPYFSDQLMHLLAKKVHDTLLCAKGNNSYRFNFHQNLLSDIIEGANKEEIIQRIEVAKLTFPEYMRVAVFKTRFFREYEFLRDALMPIVSSIIPNSPKLFRKGGVIALLEVDSRGKIDEETYSALKKLAREKGIIVGISNLFQDLELFAIYYNQALQTNTFAKRLSTENDLFFYSDYAFHILLNNVEDKTLLEYTKHPLLMYLEKYDAEKNTELYDTLKIYTQTGFSKNKTAELMFLHRNTVNYRIQQIETVFQVDLSDPTLLFRLQYSLAIDSYLKHKYFSPINLSPM